MKAACSQHPEAQCLSVLSIMLWGHERLLHEIATNFFVAIS